MVEWSVVIVSCGAGDLLHDCLSSLLRHAPPFSAEIIVVDNASGDGTAERVRREFPAVRLVANRTNRGFAAACNQGAAAAAGGMLLFLNPDTRVHAGTLSNAKAFMERNPGTGIMGCRTLNPDGTLQGTARPFPTPLRIFANVTGLSRRIPRRRRRAPAGRRLDYVQGSFLAIPRAVFHRAGGFDERFFLFGEDVDLCLRVRREGLAVRYDPHTVITHVGGGCGGDATRRTAHFIAGCLRLYAKHRGAASAARLARIVRLALAARFLGVLLSGPGADPAGRREYRRLAGLLAAARDEASA